MVSFQRAGDMSADEIYVKGLLFGDPGSGKTWAAVTAPSCLVLLTEQNGMTSVRGSNPDALVVHCADIGEVRKYLTMAVKDELRSHGIKTIVIDSLTEVQRLFKDEIFAQKGGRDTLFTQADWGSLTEKMRQFMRTLRVLKYNVVCTALAQSTIEESTGIRYVLPSFEGKRLPAEVSQYFNFVGYMAKKETTDEEGKNQTLHRALLSGGERYMTKPCHPLSGVSEVNLSEWFSSIIGEVSQTTKTKKNSKGDKQ